MDFIEGGIGEMEDKKVFINQLKTGIIRKYIVKKSI